MIHPTSRHHAFSHVKKIRNPSSLFLVVVIALLMVGCGGGADGENEKPEFSQDTPEKTFKVFKFAVVNDDWETAAKTMTPEAQQMMVGAHAVTAASLVAYDQQAEAMEQLAELYDKHGIPNVMEVDPTMGDGPIDAAIFQLGADVEDHVACLKALAAFMSEHSTEDRPSPAEELKAFTFSKATVEDDTATVVLLNDGDADTTPLNMRRIDDRWYIDYTLAE